MSDVTTAIEAVTALIGERSKFEGWLAALDSKADVPKHVLEKVRTDYTGRLRTVLRGFAAHVPALEAAQKDFQARDAVLAQQEQQSRDEHAEGELRHMVGELDREQWEQVRIGHEAQLTRIGSDRESVAGDLSSVQKALAAAVDAGKAVRDAEPAAAAPAPAPAPAPVAMAAPEPVVAAEPVPTPAMTAPVTMPDVPRAPDAAPSTSSDDLGFLRSDRAAAATPSSFTPPSTEPSRLALVSDDKAQAVATPPSSASAATAAKTLRCGECGTMNYATEWYCERCGGELAVL